MKKNLITFFMALSLVTHAYASSSPAVGPEKREVIIEGDIARYKTYEKLAPTAYNIAWKNQEIVYTIDPKSQHLLPHILKAIEYISKKTNLRFREKTDKDRDYIFFTSKSPLQPRGCWSFVGCQGGKQDLNLSYGCEHYLTVTHEILHAAGVYHEQSRPDRDEYVKIHWDNIQKGAETNFKKMNYYAVMDDTPYDYRSIMHYGGRDFGINNKPTITRLDTNQPIRRMNLGLTKHDIQGVNILYPAPKETNKEDDKEEETKEEPKVITKPIPPYKDFELTYKVDEGDKEYHFLFHFEPGLKNLDRNGNEMIKKVIYDIPDLEFKDIVQEDPYTLSLYTDADFMDVNITVIFKNGSTLRKSFKAKAEKKVKPEPKPDPKPDPTTEPKPEPKPEPTTGPKPEPKPEPTTRPGPAPTLIPSFKIENVKVDYKSYVQNGKNYYLVTVTPGKENAELLYAMTVSLKGSFREQQINGYKDSFSFKTYTRKGDLPVVIKFYLKSRKIIEKELVLKNKDTIDENKEPTINVKKVIVSETDEELSFKLQLTGDLEQVRFVHYDIHPSFGRYSTYRSRSRRRSFSTPVFKTYAEGWKTGQVTITLYDGTVIKKEGVLIE